MSEIIEESNGRTSKRKAKNKSSNNDTTAESPTSSPILVVQKVGGAKLDDIHESDESDDENTQNQKSVSLTTVTVQSFEKTYRDDETTTTTNASTTASIASNLKCDNSDATVVESTRLISDSDIDLILFEGLNIQMGTNLPNGAVNDPHQPIQAQKQRDLKKISSTNRNNNNMFKKSKRRSSSIGKLNFIENKSIKKILRRKRSSSEPKQLRKRFNFSYLDLDDR